jgi:hypothetical protein
MRQREAAVAGPDAGGRARCLTNDAATMSTDLVMHMNTVLLLT